MHERREVSLPCFVLFLNLTQACCDFCLNITKFLFQLSLLRLSSGKEALVELQRSFNRYLSLGALRIESTFKLRLCCLGWNIGIDIPKVVMVQ